MLQTPSNSTLSTTPRRSRRGHSSIALAALCVLAAFGAPTAQAKTKTNHAYKSVIRTTVLSTANGYPAVGGTAVLLGTWATNSYGHGALIDHVTITGQLTPTIVTLRGTEVAFVAHGTFKDDFTGMADVVPGGNQFISIHGRIQGGTGAYRGAKGSYTFKGMTASGSIVTNGSSSGTSSY
jgi:hypothetical protein